MANTGPAMVTGPTVVTGTSVVTGQGNLPIIRCYLSTDDVSVSTPVWMDKTAKMRNGNSSRGRNSELEDFDAGNATVAFDNRDRSFDPIATPAIKPMNQIWIFEEFSGEVQDIFKGYAESWQQTWDPSGIVDAVATVRATDEFKVMNLDVLPATGAALNTLTSSEIGDVLDNSTSHAVPRSFVAGTRNATDASGQPLPYTGQGTLSQIRLVASAELPDGAFFVNRSGALRFLPNGHRSSSPYNTVQMTFDDDGTDSPYLDCQTDFSDAFLFNQIVVTRAGGTAQTASDVTSIGSNRVRQRSYSGAPLSSDAIALTVANAVLAKYKTAFQRVTSIKPKMVDGETARLTFARDLMDRVEVFRTPPGGGARFDQQLFIQKIDVSWSPGVPPDVTLGVSPL